MSSIPDSTPGAPGSASSEGTALHPHDFEAQKRLHRTIRNDPDYDDWEYGTEPLPQEAWVAGAGAAADPAGAQQG